MKTIVESGADVHDKDNKGYGFEVHCAALNRHWERFEPTVYLTYAKY